MTDGTLTALDVLTSPGRSVRLQAKLLSSGLRAAPLGGEQLEFSLGSRSIGRAMTGGDGQAYLEYTPRMRGVETVTVGLVESKRVRSQPTQALIFAWERRRPIVLVELACLLEPPARTLPLPRGLGVALSRKPVPDAAAELKRLSEFYFNVIYLGRGAPDELEEPTELRRWLTSEKFPAGLVMAIGPRAPALESTLEGLRRDGWSNVKAAIGRTIDFAETMVRERLTVVIVPPPERGDLPRKAQVAKDWKEVRKKLQG